MDDLIKRQDAIGKIKDWMKFLGYSHGERNVMECTIQMLEELPSVQKTGHWIHYDEPQFDYKCSECGYEVWDNSDFPSYYCPNCEAYMKGEEDG